MPLIGLVLWIAVLPPIAARQEGDWCNMARVRLTGPLEGATFDPRHFALTTRVLVDLLPGEPRTLDLPFPFGPPADAESIEARALPRGAEGRAEFLEWVASEADARWRSLPRGLRARPLPPVGELRLRASAGEVLILLASLLLALGARRRPALLLASGAAGALAVLCVGLAGGDRLGPGLRLLEGDGASGLWLSVDCDRDRMRLPAGEPLRLELRTAGLGLWWTVDLRAPRPDPWMAERIGNTFYRYEAIPAGERSFDRERNRWGRLEECWVRGVDGVWSAHGRWDLGDPLPPGLEEGEGAAAPPGWLNPALPQGTGILIGRLAPGAFGSRPEPGLPHRPAWVRLLGF